MQFLKRVVKRSTSKTVNNAIPRSTR